MKAILYAGAVLMVSASIYGFIDYKKSSHNKNFRNLYDNKEQVVSSKQEPNPELVKEEPAKVSEKNRTDRSSNAPVAEVKKESTMNSGDKKPAGTKLKRKISAKKFSRAALDEKYLKEEIKIEPKKGEVKVEKNQQ